MGFCLSRYLSELLRGRRRRASRLIAAQRHGYLVFFKLSLPVFICQIISTSGKPVCETRRDCVQFLEALSHLFCRLSVDRGSAASETCLKAKRNEKHDGPARWLCCYRVSLSLRQGFSISALLPFGAGQLFVVGTVLLTVGCSAMLLISVPRGL